MSRHKDIFFDRIERAIKDDCFDDTAFAGFVKAAFGQMKDNEAKETRVHILNAAC